MAIKFFTVDSNGRLHETTEAALEGVPRRFAAISAYIALTKAEVQALEAEEAAAVAKAEETQAAINKRVAAKETARAKLEKLGLTVEEIDAMAAGLNAE